MGHTLVCVSVQMHTDKLNCQLVQGSRLSDRTIFLLSRLCETYSETQQLPRRRIVLLANRDPVVCMIQAVNLCCA